MGNGILYFEIAAYGTIAGYQDEERLLDRGKDSGGDSVDVICKGPHHWDLQGYLALSQDGASEGCHQDGKLWRLLRKLRCHGSGYVALVFASGKPQRGISNADHQLEGS